MWVKEINKIIALITLVNYKNILILTSLEALLVEKGTAIMCRSSKLFDRD